MESVAGWLCVRGRVSGGRKLPSSFPPQGMMPALPHGAGVRSRKVLHRGPLRRHLPFPIPRPTVEPVPACAWQGGRG